jgi:hypothetical protein
MYKLVFEKKNGHIVATLQGFFWEFTIFKQ